MRKVVQRPGSRGGHVYLNHEGRYVYGTPPTGLGRAASADPGASPPRPVVPADRLDVPHFGEFGEWSPDAAKLYVRQALAYAPALHRCAARYRAALGQGLKDGLAARYAFRGVQPREVEDSSAALSRLARLRAWDDHQRRQTDQGPSLLPADRGLPPAAFALAAMRAGVPSRAALRWQSISGIGDSTDEQVNDPDDAELAARLLGLPAQEEPVAKAQTPLLVKAVMRPGSRGGHVYWMNGKLHYGTPSFAGVRERRGRGAAYRPTWQAVGRLARKIIERGRRILYRATDESRKWGQIVSASGEMLSVLPDDATPYDLLHTTCVPADRVVRIVPDGQLDKSEDDDDGTRLEKGLGWHALLAGSAHEPAGDWSTGPATEAEG